MSEFPTDAPNRKVMKAFERLGFNQYFSMRWTPITFP